MAQPTSESLTYKTITELRRCIEALQEYQLAKAAEDANEKIMRENEPRKLALLTTPHVGVFHAAAHRATLDAWRMLARWRRGR